MSVSIRLGVYSRGDAFAHSPQGTVHKARRPTFGPIHITLSTLKAILTAKEEEAVGMRNDTSRRGELGHSNTTYFTLDISKLERPLTDSFHTLLARSNR